jgi:hypothetical protein
MGRAIDTLTGHTDKVTCVLFLDEQKLVFSSPVFLVVDPYFIPLMFLRYRFSQLSRFSRVLARFSRSLTRFSR